MAKAKIEELPAGVKLHREGRVRWYTVQFGSQTLSFKEWSLQTGVSTAVMYQRIFLKRWAIEAALFTPQQVVRKDGAWRTPTWHIWQGMIQRCRNPKNPSFKNYGGRGIKVCERWMDFDSFLADMGQRPAGMEIDRFPDNDGDYEPGNCRWATDAEQSRNNSRNVRLEYQGETKVLSDWASERGMAATTLWARLFKLGWTLERALTTPLRTQRR